MAEPEENLLEEPEPDENPAPDEIPAAFPVDPAKKEELVDCLSDTTFSTLDTSLEKSEASKELGA